MTSQEKKALCRLAVCGAGAALLLRPVRLTVFAAGVWAGLRGRDWIERFWHDREAML